MKSTANQNNKIQEFIMKHLVTILLSASVVAWTFIKDLISTGAEVKFTQRVEHIIKSDTRLYFDSLIDARFDINLNKSLHNPMLWYDALASDFVKEYSDKKIENVRTELDNRIREIDSIQASFIDNIGKDLGIRNEDVLPLLKKIMRDYSKNHLGTVSHTF